MSEKQQAYPLAWPGSRPRTPAVKRKNGNFRKNNDYLTIPQAVQRVDDELNKIKAKDVVISTNIEPKLTMRYENPTDPGVAVYFRIGDAPVCLATDQYTKVAQNLGAIAAHLEATRAIERHGVGTLADLFRGFLQIESKRPWWRVLQVSETADRATVLNAHRALAREVHPDRGGSAERMAEINAARDEALKAIEGRK